MRQCEFGGVGDPFSLFGRRQAQKEAMRRPREKQPLDATDSLPLELARHVWATC